MLIKINGPEVRRLREDLGISQTTLAQRAGIGRNTVTHAEIGTYRMGHNVLIARALAEALAVPLEQITVGEATSHHRPDRVPPATAPAPERGRRRPRKPRQPSPNRGA